MWRARPPAAADCKLLANARQKLDLHPLVIHDNYLINMASADPVIRPKSILAFRGELERAAAIGAEYLVAHPGSYRGICVEQGIANFASGVAEAASGLPHHKVMLLIECTAGGGSLLGARFEELRAMRDCAAALTDLPIGYCLDTCHLLAAGFDITTAAGLNQTISSIEQILGAENIKLIHANDSQAPLGSRVDRHAMIGEGHIGVEAFRRILSHPMLRQLPFILETPAEDESDDRRNLEILKKLCPKSRTITTKSS